MKFDSVIFDLDGTLWDATQAIADSWVPVLTDSPLVERIPTLADYESVMGLEPKPLMKKLFPQLNWIDAEPIWKKACIAELEYLNQHGANLYENLEEILAALSAHVKLIIVSNCNEGYIESFLHAHKLESYFIDIECAGNTGLPKSENIKLVVERNKLKNPVYVGDTLWDYEAAIAAKVPFIHAAYGFGEVPEVPALSKPTDLIPLILNKQE
ncbi:HAD family hydrolase [Scatolibacter rhodanostii]|uniref:HAD family hydrolase n=1 Tax=Scatolibacter rhodanostii TaxID=2014781 RepID=UPI000C06D0AF|nr:HAD family hydrolase [Scatolibacter rhodanostii]